MTAANTTRRQIAYTYDDVGNLTSENRSGVDIGEKDELVRYYYDGASQLVKTTVEGVTTSYVYDLAGNLLSDGEHTYTYDLQNRLLTRAGADGTTTYTYDAAGNLVKEVSSDGSVSYTYNAQNKLVKGERNDGQSSAYTYNALGARITNVQVRENQNAGHQNGELLDGSHGVNYLDFLKDGRFDWQRVFESQVGTTHQNDFETVTKHYTVDYLSVANRDIAVTEDGSWTARYVYEENGTRISAEFGYAEGTHPGEGGENLQSDFAANDIRKVWYRTSHLGSTLFAVDGSGEVISHTIYDPWGNPLTETYTDTNFSGLDNANNFTGYTWDEVLGLYFAQNRFYDSATHRFTQEDIVKDGGNWYVYCGNNPTNLIDWFGFDSYVLYNPTMFSFDISQLWGHAIAEVYQYKSDSQVQYKQIYSSADFIREWNSMNDSEPIDAVVGLFHSSPTFFEIRGHNWNFNTSSGTVDYMTLNDISQLMPKNINLLMWPQCNGGHLNYELNIAQTFLNLGGINKVLADDGTTWNWSSPGQVQSLGGAVRQENGLWDTAWTDWLSTDNIKEKGSEIYCYTVYNNKLVCFEDAAYRYRISRNVVDRNGTHSVMLGNAGWIMYQGDYRVRVSGTNTVFISSLIRTSRAFNVYNYDLSGTAEYRKTKTNFQNTLAWNLVINRFSTITEDQIIKTRMQYPDLYDTIMTLLSIEQSQDAT